MYSNTAMSTLRIFAKLLTVGSFAFKRPWSDRESHPAMGQHLQHHPGAPARLEHVVYALVDSLREFMVNWDPCRCLVVMIVNMFCYDRPFISIGLTTIDHSHHELTRCLGIMIMIASIDHIMFNLMIPVFDVYVDKSILNHHHFIIQASLSIINH